MKILYITHMNEANGSTIALKNIMLGMHKKGATIGLICPNANGFLYTEALKLGVKIFLVKDSYPAILQYPSLKGLSLVKWILSMIVWHLKIQLRVYKIMKLFKPDIVHCNTSVIDYGLLGAKLLKIPHVWHIREYQDLDFNINIFPSKTILKRKMHLSGNYNIAITNEIYKYFNLRKCDNVIYDGVIDISHKKDSPIEFAFPYILYVGNISKGKGLDVLLKQFVKFHILYPDVHIIVANKFDSNSKYYKYCISILNRAECSKFVHFIGFRDDVYSLMRSALVLVVPSYFEGFGFITAEAMYNNCLVIGRNTAGTKEQFDNGYRQTGHEIGLRFTKDEEIIELLKRVMTEDFSLMKYYARKTVVNNYTVNINVNSIYSYYKKII